MSTRHAERDLLRLVACRIRLHRRAWNDAIRAAVQRPHLVGAGLRRGVEGLDDLAGARALDPQVRRNSGATRVHHTAADRVHARRYEVRVVRSVCAIAELRRLRGCDARAERCRPPADDAFRGDSGRW